MSLTRAGPLQWRAGAGWLVLAGGGSWQENQTGDVDAAVLGWADLDRPMVVLPGSDSSTAEAEALIDYYVDLGGPRGYVVPIVDTDRAQLADSCQLLREAGLIYVADGSDPVDLVWALHDSPAMDAMTSAFESGAVLLGMGSGAAALGSWIADPDRGGDQTFRAEPGLGWLHNIILAPHFGGTEGANRLQRLLNMKPNCMGMGIPEGVALGLGPSGEVENLGSGQVTVVVSGLEVEV